jgi:digeranylgeranylglycerophospholipid reductase
VARVLVIGGGPGGLYAAAEAAKRGFDVTLMEKGKIGENIRCAEGFFDVLKRLGKPCAGVRFKVEELVIKAGSTYRFDVKPLFLWMIDRSTWQKELARRAAETGVIIKEDSPVNPKELKKLKGDYDFIIDASGAPSITSRVYGFSGFYKNHCGRTVQYTVEGDFSHIGNRLKVGFLPDFWGYYWIFPKGKDEQGGETANVGIGNFDSADKRKLWCMLDDVMRREGFDGPGYRVIKSLGGICPSKMPEKLIYDNILLVGDAAGLTSPLHGGGIDMAVISGIEAARAISKDLAGYERRIRSIFSRRLEFEKTIATAWGKMSFERMERILARACKFKFYRILLSPRFYTPATAALFKFIA